MATNMGRMALAMERSIAFTMVDASALLGAVRGVPEISEQLVQHAFEYPYADPVKARAFMVYDPVARASFLHRHLHHD